MPVKKRKTAAKKKPSKKKVIRKAPAKRAAKPKPAKAKPAKAKPSKPKPSAKKRSESGVIGKVTHYFPHVNAAVIKLKTPLGIGDTIRIKGHTTDIKETVTSMQIDRAPITVAKKGDEIGLLVSSRVRAGDKVYKG